MRRNKPWFGPMPYIGKAICPVSWEGYAVTVALVVGVGLMRFVDDPVRRVIALTLVVGAYCAVLLLTWSKDPD